MSDYSLPPSVSGKLHGFCELFIEDIKWTTTKTYSTVKISIQFWGENKPRVFNKVEIKNFDKRLKYSTSIKINPLLTITYKVCTNHRLFQSYLKNCEPISVEIFSSKTSDLIGKSSIEIPQELHNLEHNCTSQSVIANILSGRNFKLGELKISFEVKLNINCCTMIVKPPISLKTNPEKDILHKSIKSKQTKVTINNNNKKGENKENLQIVGKAISMRDQIAKKQQVSIKTTKGLCKKQTSINHKRVESNKSTTTSSISDNALTNEDYSKYNLSDGTGKLSLINYLSGQHMTNSDESRILSDLMQLSPSQSLIDDIKINSVRRASENDGLKCLRVLVNVLELNDNGYEDIRNYFNNFSNAKFIFKCALTSKLFKFRDNMNFLSSVMEYPSHRITFSRELRKNVKVPERSSHSYLNFGFCLKTIDYKYTSSHLIGFSRISVEEVLRNNCSFFKKCAVVNENNIRVASVTINVEITDEWNPQDQYPPIYRQPTSKEVVSQKYSYKPSSHPTTSSNDDCDNHGDRNFEHKNMQTDDNDLRSKGSSRKENSNDENRDTEMIDVEIKNSDRKARIYQGVLFIEALKNVRDQRGPSEYFITYEGFWNECQEMTDVSVEQIFNYLKQFDVMFDQEFLRKVQNSHMELKLWEKSNENAEKFIASTKVPLHQFYIAFKDIEMIEHLSTNKLPVISTDTWCNFISPLSSELYCQAKILLAIGSENQIDFMKLSRNLHNLQPPQRTCERNSPIPSDPNAQIKSKLTAFIESLSQKLPEPNGATAINQQKFSSPSISSNSSIVQHSAQQPQLRKTSDLLDTLQKALSQPPTNETFSLFQQPAPSEMSINSITSSADWIKMNVIIEHAANLPKVVVKKYRGNKRKNKGTPQQKCEYEPHTYATFEARTDHLNENSLPQNAIKSHEGIVYCTKVIKGVNPEWNQSFDVRVAFDILRNPQKKFVVKVWRKTFHEPSEVEPAPFQDSVIGFSAIDISVLLTGLPVLSGYYNLVDFSGRSNGQLKVSLKPLEDVNRFRNPSSPLVPLTQPLNIDVSSSESSNDGSNLLSRTLKRKFTELDEITQRLRARLFDVTGDENFDPDEEFERDLNTAVDEMEDEQAEDFAWLKKDNDDNNKINEFMKFSDSRPSTSKAPSSIPTQREITGCSSETSQFAIDDLLKKYDLDTLINPNIFKNLLDPTLANSDSTPTLNNNPVKTNNDEKDNQDESDVTTISSIISNDQVQMIQKALQRTSLHEDDQNNSSRLEPDGNEINK